jgi:hypothetical protein
MHTETIIAIATVGLFIVTTALAVYTALLWRATGRLVKGAEDTAERQLRAYVCVEKSTGAEAREDPMWPAFKIVVRNFGRTPAYDFVGQVGVGVDVYPLASPPAPPPEGVDTSLRSSTILGPDCESTFMAVFRNKPDPAQVRAINEGRAAMWVRGFFTYRDAFGKARQTTCCLVWRDPVKGLQQYSSGNDAT